ncbi:MAG: 4Fe-4S binding protein [Candidatus Eisenbacteria sp.]|nr:4Fe-4S binding protein [Candidatus Eisenbacteria bacterium]
MRAHLSTTYLGMDLKSPIVVAPAGITETAERIGRCEEHGAGAVVMKTMAEPEIMRQSPTPRFRLLKKGKGLRHFVLYSYEQASQFGPEAYAAELEKSRKRVTIPVIASIACTKERSWIEMAQMMESAGANALEINLSCPHGPDMSLDSGIEARITRITGLVASAVKIPVVAKLPSQLTDPSAVAKGVQEAGAKGVVIFNRLVGLDVDVESQAPIMHGAFAGHGGYWSIHYPLRWVAELSPLLAIDIAASGGVASGEDAIKFLLVGASVVQICTAVIVNGYGIISQINAEITDYAARHNFRSMSELRGLACDRVLGLQAVDRRRKVRARIDGEKCNHCGACYRACFHGTIVPDREGYAITSDCTGCGLCAEICDCGAISMVPLSGAETGRETDSQPGRLGN